MDLHHLLSVFHCFLTFHQFLDGTNRTKAPLEYHYDNRANHKATAKQVDEAWVGADAVRKEVRVYEGRGEGHQCLDGGTETEDFACLVFGNDFG